MFGILEAITVPRTSIFPTFEGLVEDLNDRMVKEGYKIVKSRSHRSRSTDVPNNGLYRCDLVCDRGGRPYKCTATKRKTHTKKTDCPWKAKAVHRKAAGGWVLTVICDQHNHEPGTPEPPSADQSDAENNEAETSAPELPTLDADTSSAVQVAGISEATVRLNGDTFNQLKKEYRNLTHDQRWQILSTLQLRTAAIYAVQNEDVQRQRRQEAQDKRHREVESINEARLGGYILKKAKRARMNNGQELVSDAGQAADQLAPNQLHGPPLMNDTQLRLNHGAMQAAVPMPNMGISHFQPFANHSNLRGQD